MMKTKGYIPTDTVHSWSMLDTLQVKNTFTQLPHDLIAYIFIVV